MIMGATNPKQKCYTTLMKKYTGGCHCGAVRFEVSAGEFTTGMTCNCSYCSKRGFILSFVPAEQFALLSGEDNLTTYHFNKKVIDHLFCKTCGVQAFGRGKGHDGNDTVALNLRCIDDLDVSTLTLSEYNGKDV